MALSLVIVTVSWLLLKADAQCPATCICTTDVIDCSNRGFNQLPDVTRPLPLERLARLDFSNNRIRILDIDRLFQSLRGLQVTEIDFSSNAITEVNGTFDALQGKDYVVLNLSRNALQTFPSRVIPVNHFPVTYTLDISYNRLTELTRNMFAGGDDLSLPGFQFIATNNLISSIHPETFQGLDLLDAVVDLRSNLIRTLDEAFQPPRSVSQLRFSDNPWRCDCDLSWIITPSNRLVNFTADDPPACQTPPALQGRPIFQLKEDDFACLPFQTGGLQQNFINMDTFVVRCPVTAVPPQLNITWQVWIPCSSGQDPIQLFFDSETVGLRGLTDNPRAAFKCTATNNAGSLSLSLDIRYNGIQGIPVPECPAAVVPEEC